MTPSRAGLQAILEGCGIVLAADQLDRLWAYHRRLHRANPELNLTRTRNFANLVRKHYVDSLLVLRYEPLPSPLVDLGSGPGLPGIPLKIAAPGVQVILAEPRRNRAAFLEGVCRELGLDGIEVHAGKVGPRFPHRPAGFITRAVESIPETLERVGPLLDPGGKVLLLKGPGCDAEIEAARRSSGPAFTKAAEHRYVIPGTRLARRLLVYERTGADPGVATTGAARAEGHAGPVTTITSPANATFQLYRELLQGRGVRKHGLALVAGPRIVAEVLERHRDQVAAWLTTTTGPPPGVGSLAWVRLAPRLFRELDPAGTDAPLLLARVPEIPAWSAAEPWPEGCSLFLPFQDPENIGAAIRSAAAFGVAQVVLLREAAHPFHPKALRAAGPTVFETRLRRGPSLRDLDPAAGPWIALAVDGEALDAAPWPERFGLVAGLEGPGLPERLRCAPRRRVPIAAGVESLNAAAAVAVALYAWSRSRRAGAGP